MVNHPLPSVALETNQSDERRRKRPFFAVTLYCTLETVKQEQKQLKLLCRLKIYMQINSLQTCAERRHVQEEHLHLGGNDLRLMVTAP